MGKARENILTEIRNNKKQVDQALPELQKEEENLNHIIHLAHALETAPPPKNSEMNFHWPMSDLYSTAWRTASTSGAVTYMTYGELQRYTDAYNLQEDFSPLQQRAFGKTMQLGPLIEATMEQRDWKTVPREKFVEIQQDATREYC